MYSVFCKLPNGQLKFLASAIAPAQSFFLCKVFSMKGDLPIVAVVNFNDGTTEQCCQFEKGKLTWHAPKCDPILQVCCPDGERDQDMAGAGGNALSERPDQPPQGPHARRPSQDR